jgi:hypothetical protein
MIFMPYWREKDGGVKIVLREIKITMENSVI